VIDGPINGAFFRLYVEQVLAPTLNRGDIVVLDNLGSHKGKAAAPPSGPEALTSSSCRPTAPT
jgi:transposase